MTHMDDLLSTREVAELLGLHPTTVRRACSAGHLASHITLRGRMVRRVDALRWGVVRSTGAEVRS